VGIAPADFRLPIETRVGAVSLLVSDLQRSTDYYERVIGLQVQTRTASRVTLGAQGGDRALLALQTRAGVLPSRRGAFGLYHFALLLPDRSALGRCAAHLAGLKQRVAAADHLVSEALYLWDPDGLGIEIYADRPRREWRQIDREVVMATEPLDVAGLVVKAGDRRWAGAPTGTQIGHVHLHVGSLEEAEAFYHLGLGLDKTAWSYPGALFLAAGEYHHHLGTNVWAPGPSPGPDRAQLIEWELIVPAIDARSAAAERLRGAGYHVDDSGADAVARDPWGTAVRIAAAH
jgi:catechol 2,3-dioxygenase